MKSQAGHAIKLYTFWTISGYFPNGSIVKAGVAVAVFELVRSSWDKESIESVILKIYKNKLKIIYLNDKVRDTLQHKYFI